MSRRPRSSVAGRSVNPLSVITLSFLAVFLAAIMLLVVADLLYTDSKTILDLFRSREVLAAMRLTAITSVITLVLVVLFAVPVVYALSRYRFPGHRAADVLVDLPIVLPPVVVGISLLVLFATWPGRWIAQLGFNPHSVMGIVLCQFFVSASFAIRASKAAFDGVDRRLENLALTLGCTRLRAFRMVALPMAGSGLLAGAIMAWARAVGVFGPLMVFVGSVRLKTEVMPTTIYLELTIGRVEAALAVAIVMLLVAAVALALIRWLAGTARWWGI